MTLVAADSPSSFLDDGPTSNLIRHILGAVSEFDKAMTVAKLKGARDRVRRAQGKCEGRKTYAEREGGQELVALARQRRGNLHGQPHLNARARGLSKFRSFEISLRAITAQCSLAPWARASWVSISWLRPSHPNDFNHTFQWLAELTGKAGRVVPSST